MPARGLVYAWESGVGVTSHKDVAAPVLTFLLFPNPKSYCCCCCSWMHLTGCLKSPRGWHPGTWLTAGRTLRWWDEGQQLPLLLLQSRWTPTQPPPALDMWQQEQRWGKSPPAVVTLVRQWMRHGCSCWIQRPHSPKHLGVWLFTWLLLSMMWILCTCSSCSSWHFAWCTVATLLPLLAKSAIFHICY